MKRKNYPRYFLPVLLILLQPFWQACSHSRAGQKETPAEAVVREPGKLNFVIILMDDLGWADVGFNGSTFFQTPNLNRMAAQSVQFTQAYAASPVCSPTRAALLTGQHPARLQLTDWLPGRTDRPSQKLLRAPLRPELPLAVTTLPEALKGAGYTSANIGKWHLGGEGFGPRQQGFDLNIAGDHTGTPISYFYPYVSRDQPTHRMPGLEKGEEGEYLTDRLTTEAEQFLERNRDQPFLLYLAHYAVHIPMKARQELIAKYQALAKPGEPQHNAVYAAMIESMDESVGRILRKLEALKLDQNTVVIFTSDNGGLSVEEGPNTPATSNAPLREGKGHLYEGGIRVPLLVLLPGARQKKMVSEVPVTLTDLYPTILELARVQPTPGKPLDGKSLVPVLEGHPIPQRALYWHYPHYSNQGGRPGWAIREGKHKLIEFFEDGSQALYNLEADPGEQSNLLKKNPRLASSLAKKLHAWGERVNAQKMRPNPDYKPVTQAK